MSDKPFIYGSDIVPQEEHYELHQRAHIKLTWGDLLRLTLGKRIMFSLCLRLIVLKDKEGKFISLDRDAVGSRIVLVDSLEDVETVDAHFSHDNYSKLHKT